jgi:endo-1,4-beta-xylanase
MRSAPQAERPARGEGALQQAAVPSLAALYQRYFPIGAAVEPQTLVSQGDLLAAQVNSLVAENAMKWERIHPLPGDGPASYDFAGADAIVEYARAHGMKVRGHNLVWHNQTPDWVFQGEEGPATETQLLSRLRSHVVTLLAHFRDRVYCWDVVNEALSEGTGEWRTGSPWQRLAGSLDGPDGVPVYIGKAFEYARAADPAARLFYNDYGIEAGAKLESTMRLVKALRERAIIDGVGIQGHWTVSGPEAETVRHAIQAFASLGVEVQITELDVSLFPSGDTSALREARPDLLSKQAGRYGSYFRVFREEAQAHRLTGVTLWGIADDHTWLDDFPVKGRKDWPLLFDALHRPKDAFWTVARW